MLLAAPALCAAQQPSRMARIGVLVPSTMAAYAPRMENLRASLRDLGQIEGRHYVFEYRVAEGKTEKLPALAAELVGLGVDVIVTAGTPATRALKQATATIPIVMAANGDAIATGLIASLARPGGNITGTTYFAPELHVKRLELLTQVVPQLRRVGVLVNPENLQIVNATLPALRSAADLMKIELVAAEARNPTEFEGAFSAMVNARAEAVAIADDPMFIFNFRALADLATAKRLPSNGAKEYAEVGGLIGYGANLIEIWRQAGSFVDRILKGARPADLPVEQATKFELVLNLKTAKAIGAKVPQSLLVRADSVIE